MRRHFTLFSVVAHAVVITAALLAQQLDVGALPTPHQPVLFEAADIMRADIQLPKPPQRTTPGSTASSQSPAVSPDAAPTVAPTDVAPETGREGVPPSSGPIVGVENAAPGGVETLSGGGVPPAPPPAPVAQRARVEGVVILEAVIDAQGRVASVRILRSIALLDQAAVDAVRQWRFTPALLNEQAVPVFMTVTVNFRLRDR